MVKHFDMVIGGFESEFVGEKNIAETKGFIGSRCHQEDGIQQRRVCGGDYPQIVDTLVMNGALAWKLLVKKDEVEMVKELMGPRDKG